MNSDFNPATSLIFELENNIGILDPKQEKLPNLEGAHTWLSSIFSAKNKEKSNPDGSRTILSFDAPPVQPTDSGRSIRYGSPVTKKHIPPINKDSVVILDDGLISSQMDATHQGLMQYLFSAWAKELGVVLKPDIIFYTIISEIKNEIINDPETYRQLFTTSDKKTKIILVGLTIDNLMNALESQIPCRDLFNLITKTSFSTAPVHFNQILGITMADMGTPYYYYGSTRCGIPRVAISGDESEWLKLIGIVTDLKNIFEPLSKMLGRYLEIIFGTLNDLVKAVFYDKNNDYLREMFIYHKNPYCGSGHEPIVLKGWARHFYIGEYFTSSRKFYYDEYINKFRSHINCLPYNNEDDPNDIKYYFYACGLSSSRIVDGFLYPEYNIAHCEIVHSNKKEIFDVIAANNK